MTMIEGESEKEVKQGKNNHLGDEIEIDLMDILGLFWIHIFVNRDFDFF